MANREGSAGAGLCPPVADGSPTLQLAGQGAAGEDPLQGREGSKAARSGDCPKPTCVHIAAGFTVAGIGSGVCLSFPIRLQDARCAKRCLG